MPFPQQVCPRLIENTLELLPACAHPDATLVGIALAHVVHVSAVLPSGGDRVDAPVDLSRKLRLLQEPLLVG
jgi:hypothetical protein